MYMSKKRKILIIFGILIILFIIVFVVINKANIFSQKVTKLQLEAR